MIDLEQVRTFIAIIEVGSFRGAARSLGIAQPTASQHIKKLEATLSRPLLERNRIRAETTPDGARFLPYARTLLKIAERAKVAVGGGSLAIGASGNIGVYMLQPLVRAFQLAEPRIAPIDIRIGTNSETAKRLEEAEVDIGLMEWWDARAGFDAHPWREERLVVIVPPDHRWAALAAIDKDSLLEEPMIGGESGTGTTRLLNQMLGAATEFKMGLRLGSTEAVKQAVRAGLGIAIVFESAVRDEVRSGLLKALEIIDTPLSKPLFAIVPSDLPEHSPGTRFAEFLRAVPGVF